MIHNKAEPNISLCADALSGSLLLNSKLPFKSKELCLNTMFYYNLKHLPTMSGLSLLSFQTADKLKTLMGLTYPAVHPERWLDND